MKAIICENAGPEGYAVCSDVPEPVAGCGEVTVETRHMSVNFPDVLQIKGRYQHMPESPFTLGMEYSGVVRDVGAGVTDFKSGDRVVGLAQGAFAEVIKSPATLCYPLATGLDFDEGALLPLAGGAALCGLTHRAQLREGETLVVTGAAGGTGLAAIQIGRALGARVIAICSSDKKVAAAMGAGAHAAINQERENLVGQLKKLLNGGGIDVLYDTVGGELFDICCRRVGWNGRILVVGFASGKIPRFPINLALVKGYSLIGVNWNDTINFEPDLAGALIAELMRLCLAKSYVPVVDSCLPLEQGAEAIQRMSERKVIGKILLASSRVPTGTV